MDIITNDLISRKALDDSLLYDFAFHFKSTPYSERKGYRKRDSEVRGVLFNMKAVYSGLEEKIAAALKAREPMMVNYYGDGYADGEMVYDMAECPECGYQFDEGYRGWEDPFCCNCGQALKWD